MYIADETQSVCTLYIEYYYLCVYHCKDDPGLRVDSDQSWTVNVDHRACSYMSQYVCHSHCACLTRLAGIHVQ